MTFTVKLSDTQKVTTFTASDTWTKDPRAQTIQVILWNSGQGGGSGRKGASTLAGGGGGGANSGGIYALSSAVFFGNTETVTIGGIASGGIAQTTDSTNGNPGGFGNHSYFGNIGANVPASSSGLGGTTGATATGGTGAGIISLLGSEVGSQNGATGSNATPSAPNATVTAYNPSPGGGGSGASLVSALQGSAGGAIKNQDSTITIVTGANGGIESGTIAGSKGADASATTSGAILVGGAGGGGGGGQHTVGAGLKGGKGGDGGYPGGGGGGGGGGLNTTDATGGSGAGGDGAAGQVIVIEYF